MIRLWLFVALLNSNLSTPSMGDLIADHKGCPDVIMHMKGTTPEFYSSDDLTRDEVGDDLYVDVQFLSDVPMFFPATTLVRGFNIRLHIDTQLGSHLGNLTDAQNLFVELPVKYMARTLGLIEELVKYGIPTMKVRYPTFLDTGQFTSYDPPDPFTTLTSDSIQFHFYMVVEMFEPIWKPYNVDIFFAPRCEQPGRQKLTSYYKFGMETGLAMWFGYVVCTHSAGPASHHPLQQKLASTLTQKQRMWNFHP
ncbi:hypothetical protein HanRHA438_Chr16g0773321 [Helianthus annuus]|nr:hypothetical protein HanRHA438_Chr16g0773321 [Helianthus annuus]